MIHRVSIWSAVSALALAAVALPAGAGPMLESRASSASIEYAETPPFPIVEEDDDFDVTGSPGVGVGADSLVCPGSGPCAILPPMPGDPWYFGTSAAAEARTNYGTNRARAFAAGADAYPGGEPWVEHEASAQSLFEDELLLLGGAASGTTLDVTFRLDGSFSGDGRFSFEVGLFDPTVVFPQGLGFLGDWAVISNCLGDCAQHLSGAGQNIDVTSESFDETVTVSMPYVGGATYGLFASLWVQAPNDGSPLPSIVSSYSSGRVTALVIPPGGAVVPTAGSLSDYAVVPEPSTALLLCGALAALAACRRAWPPRR